MSQEPDVVCFQCGQHVGEPLQVNSLPSGEPCTACQNRVLDALPSLLPSDGESLRKSQPVSEDVWSRSYDDDPPEPA